MRNLLFFLLAVCFICPPKSYSDEGMWLPMLIERLNMDDMQIGSQGDRTGWEVYNACKNGGAIIATGHEHSYHRTKTLIDIENQNLNIDFNIFLYRCFLFVSRR